MCIKMTGKQIIKKGTLTLWKVIRKDNQIGLWKGTGWREPKQTGSFYHVGTNKAHSFIHPESLERSKGEFHCFFTRKEARQYTHERYERTSSFRDVNKGKKTKIVKVYAESGDVVLIGIDSLTSIPSISVRKMQIKSLNHCR